MRLTLLTVALLALGACASAPVGQGGSVAGVAPMLSVERFLQAANTGDLVAMARIFGNADGAIADETSNAFVCAFKRMGSWVGLGERCLSWVEIELRMNAIAVVIQHDDYRVRAESPVPGRGRPTTRVSVDIARGADQFMDVPFLVVQSSDGRWLVEEIGLAQLTAMGASPLDQFPHDASRAAGMEERDEVASGAGPRLFVDELKTTVAQHGELSADIRDAIGEVV